MNRNLTISAQAVLLPGETADVSFVPPLVRRRLSPLQKVYFALRHALGDDGTSSGVFASRDGEDTLTRRIVDDFHVDGSVSPHRFSASVYNASPGLWSVLAHDRSAYTAIAAGKDTVECGLIEALAGNGRMTYVYAEETCGGYGAAVLFDEVVGGRRLSVTNGDPQAEAIGFDAWVAFLRGERRELCGRWLTLRDAT